MASHAPDSPDRAPSDFFLFGHGKRALQGSEFQSVEEFLEAVVRILNTIVTDTFIGTLHEQIKGLEASIDHDGEYVESKLF
jgi:hypothetical protein